MSKVKSSSKITKPYRPLKKTRVAFAGLAHVLKYDVSVTYKLLISVVLLALSVWQGHNFNAILLVIATGNVVSTELLNSSIELLCDFHTTAYNPKIKVIKDVSALAVSASIVVWVLAVGVELRALWLGV